MQHLLKQDEKPRKFIETENTKKRKTPRFLSICNLLIFTVVNGVSCDPLCGFPAVPNNAEVEGYFWGLPSYQTFRQGTQLTFSCQFHFYDFLKLKSIKTCSNNGTWIGKEIRCYERIGPPYYSMVINSSKTYDDDSSIIYSNQFVGDVELVMNNIYSIEFIGLDFQNNVSHPEISIGKHDCVAGNRTVGPNSRIRLLYSCSSRKTKSFFVSFSQPTHIFNISAFHLPENKCDLRPEIPLNASAKMEGSETVHYECRDGFRIKGSPTRKCDPKSGQWLPDRPTCEMINTSNKASSAFPFFISVMVFILFFN